MTVLRRRGPGYPRAPAASSTTRRPSCTWPAAARACWPGSRRWSAIVGSRRAGGRRPAPGARACRAARRPRPGRWSSAAWRWASTPPRTRARSPPAPRRWPCSAAAPTSPTRAPTAGCTRGSCAAGLIVSEYPPGTEPAPWRFPARNRLIAALADAVVVVEAQVRSGALITADHALDLGRDVLAVPGWPAFSGAGGTNALLKAGAGLVESVEDLHGWLGSGRPGRGRPPDGDPVLSALRDAPAYPDELAARLRLAPAELSGRARPARAGAARSAAIRHGALDARVGGAPAR